MIGPDAATCFVAGQNIRNGGKKCLQAIFQFLPRHWFFNNGGELIPADSADLAVLADNIAQVGRNSFQYRVAGCMSEGVID